MTTNWSESFSRSFFSPSAIKSPSPSTLISSCPVVRHRPSPARWPGPPRSSLGPPGSSVEAPEEGTCTKTLVGRDRNSCEFHHSDEVTTNTINVENIGKLTHKCTSFSKQSTRGHFRNKPCLPGDAASKNPKLPGHCAILCHIVPRKIGTQPTLRLICSLAACTEIPIWNMLKPA